MSMGSSRANQNMWAVAATVFELIWALATRGQAATARHD
jgi:hypothetical protein